LSTFVPLRVAVLTISDTRTAESDTSGNAAVELLMDEGHHIVGREIVRDEIPEIRTALRRWLTGADVVVTTGGTGLTARDVTPEAVAPLITRAIPGFGELFRMLSYAEIGTSTIQSRAEAAVCGDAIVFMLPGSPSAVRTAMQKIVLQQLDARTRPCNFVELLPRIRGQRP
jgi:molybdopterin adenylyltransferase